MSSLKKNDFGIDISSEIRYNLNLNFLAIIAVIILILVNFAVIMSSDDDDSYYTLNLVDGENRMKKVTSSPPGSTTFEMLLAHANKDCDFSVEIQLQVSDLMYFGGSQESHWKFQFLDENYDVVSDGVYLITDNDNDGVVVILRVSFKGSDDGEKVTFTINGHNVTEGERIETHLSPRGGPHSAYEYLTVYTGAACDVFWEPSSFQDRRSHLLPCGGTYYITLWNLGTTQDSVEISEWEVWEDKNENGIIDTGDTQNQYFSLEFHYTGGEEYDIGDPIVLGSLDSEELKVTVIPDPDKDKVPGGHYLIQITVESQCGAEHVDTLKAHLFLTDLLEELITILEDMEDIPEKAKKHVEDAIDRLDQAIDEFDEFNWEDGFAHIEKAVKELMNAKKKGANVQEFIDELVYAVDCIVSRALENVISMVGEDNDHVQDAKDDYEEALEQIDDGDHESAIKYYNKAFQDIMLAHCNWIPEPYLDELDDRLSEVRSLILEDPPKAARNYLESAEDEIEDAIEEAEDGDLIQSFTKLSDAIQNLVKAGSNGVEVDEIIESIIENIEDAVSKRITDAEGIRGSENSNVEDAWDYYEDALEELEGDDDDDSKYTKAIHNFNTAVQKTEKALTDG